MKLLLDECVTRYVKRDLTGDGSMSMLIAANPGRGS
jgi:hypothetical protein